MTLYAILLLLIGVAILGVAWLPSLLEKYPLSYPILYIGLGMLAFILPFPFPNTDPSQHQAIATHLTELCVIVALTGTGLKIDHRFSWRTWATPLRLVGILMVLSIAVLAVLGWWLVALAPASALLLASSLAPTDPVLAGDVQIKLGKPDEGHEDPVRFALTGEAGLNDGLAFPFVLLAIALLPGSLSLGEVLLHWLWKDLLYRLVVGLAAGWLSGQLLAYLIFKLPAKMQLKPAGYGFVALAITLISYAGTELLHGYGFLAVFIAAITVRSKERKHEYHKQMHTFSDQLERLFIVVILTCLGAAIAGGLLRALTWQGAALGLLLVLVVRPALGMLTLLGSRLSITERWVISGFGIRGIGSLFYIAFALQHAHFPQARQLWAITGFVVLVSIVLHGVLATPVMTWLDRRLGRPVETVSDQSGPEEAK
ncbi:cation:proton antiporter [Hymenobacter sp. ASUV-10]|uniref:Cation:proton antiporter n=1 Tax=Hymenobacter aranciens TaxID=3063996 RepID=A0ABT9BEP7_9BACT|nr:cation:proton antiporter [Hymenobacter sp. ASUV-10]MDO7876707.1 cation:proton antiporter [Hymenobacter sp. ASUV-10]